LKCSHHSTSAREDKSPQRITTGLPFLHAQTLLTASHFRLVSDNVRCHQHSPHLSRRKDSNTVGCQIFPIYHLQNGPGLDNSTYMNPRTLTIGSIQFTTCSMLQGWAIPLLLIQVHQQSVPSGSQPAACPRPRKKYLPKSKQTRLSDKDQDRLGVQRTLLHTNPALNTVTPNMEYALWSPQDWSHTSSLIQSWMLRPRQTHLELDPQHELAPQHAGLPILQK